MGNKDEIALDVCPDAVRILLQQAKMCCGTVAHQPSLLDCANKVVVGNTTLALRIAELERQKSSLIAVVTELNAIIKDSSGVAGYHLNGDIAEWDEFDIPNLDELLGASK